MEGLNEHWDLVYARRDDDLSWFQATPEVSLRLIETWTTPTAGVVDVGSGTSTLVDQLLDRGYRDLTLVDVSGEALRRVATRLGPRAATVTMVEGDVLEWRPQRRWDLWHDRAVFHFLTDEEGRAAYVDLATGAVRRGGTVVLGTFALDGSTACSGLETARYDAAAIEALFAPAFCVVHDEPESHVTPWGATQSFRWFVLRRD